MNKIVKEFLRRGIAACGLGPIILMILYLILQHKGAVEVLTVNEVCIGISSLTVLAFLAGGMNSIYQIEQLPLMGAVTIHGSVLYMGYLAVYLINGWLQTGAIPILVFTVIFAVGYLAIWSVIYLIIKRNTEKVNAVLRKKQQRNEAPPA